MDALFHERGDQRHHRQAQNGDGKRHADAELAPRLMGGRAGNCSQKGRWAVPTTVPTMKKTSVTSMRAEPPPTVNNVPEPQPPPSCMPSPNSAAPNTTETPTGASAPTRDWPPSVPAATSGSMARLATPMASICARMPRPRRSTTMRRQPPVKPNEP